MNNFFGLPPLDVYGMGANSPTSMRTPTFGQVQTFGQPYLPPPQMQMPDMAQNQNLLGMFENPQKSMGGLKQSVQDYARSAINPAIESIGASMGIPPGITSAITSRVLSGGGFDYDPIPQAPQMSLLQFDRPAQVANGSTQYLQSLQGLLV
jgi:hypothetical protein